MVKNHYETDALRVEDVEDVGQERHRRKPVHGDGARQVLMGDRPRSVIEVAQLPGRRRTANLPKNGDGLIAKDAADVRRRHEGLQFTARRAI